MSAHGESAGEANPSLAGTRPISQAGNRAMAQPGPVDASGASDGTTTPYVQDSEFVVWEKYEQIAMHFNDLIMRLRTQALAGLTAVIAVAGVVINLTTKPGLTVQWEIIFFTICFFAAAWLALFVLDFFYYTKLLEGAVAAIVAHERRTPSLEGVEPPTTRINLSTVVKAQVPWFKVPIVVFYVIVMGALLFGAWYAWIQMQGAATAPPTTQVPSQDEVNTKAKASPNK